MEFNLVVRAAPQEFICRPGCWDDLERHLERRSISSVLVLHGSRSWKAAEPYFPRLERAEARFMQYGGECTYAERDRVAAAVRERSLQAIVGIGGGKVLDTAKSAAALLGIPVILLPTLASTCAAWSALSVMYGEDGAAAGYDVFPRSNALVLLDPDVILHSPRELLVAGIGDTLAKWYEADAIIAALPSAPAEIVLAHMTARLCRDNLLACAEEALRALDEGQRNEAFVRVVETNIMIGGLVGGFGEHYGRTSGAHAIHDALTALPQTHRVQHGHKVAYGVLVQLALERKWAEIVSLLPLYERLGLPSSLEELGLSLLSRRELMELGERAAAESSSIHRLPDVITASKVVDAVEALEAYVCGLKGTGAAGYQATERMYEAERNGIIKRQAWS